MVAHISMVSTKLSKVAETRMLFDFQGNEDESYAIAPSELQTSTSLFKGIHLKKKLFQAFGLTENEGSKSERVIANNIPLGGRELRHAFLFQSNKSSFQTGNWSYRKHTEIPDLVSEMVLGVDRILRATWSTTDSRSPKT